VLNLDFRFQYLQDAGLYENQEEAICREEVLGRLDQVEFILLFDRLHCDISIVDEKING
jgi:hypothetical protein